MTFRDFTKITMEYSFVSLPAFTLMLILGQLSLTYLLLAYLIGWLFYSGVTLAKKNTDRAYQPRSSRLQHEDMLSSKKTSGVADSPFNCFGAEKDVSKLINRMRGDFIQKENEIFKKLHNYQFESEKVQKDLESLRKDQEVLRKKSQQITTAWGSYRALSKQKDQRIIDSGAGFSIEDKMQSLEEIVSQTHLLSFNASIEAARAGVAGQGFSVVASEIAMLAKSASEVHNAIRLEVSKVSKIIKVDENHSESLQKIERDLNHSLEYLSERCNRPMDLTFNEESLDFFEKDLSLIHI